MRAVDTNILVRFLTADDPQQALAARQLIEAGDIFIGTTVILETEWVLRAGYKFSPAVIARGFRGLGGLPGIVIEEPDEIAQALNSMVDGMDFADALHLARSSHCSVFVTFDKKLETRCRGQSAITIHTL